LVSAVYLRNEKEKPVKHRKEFYLKDDVLMVTEYDEWYHAHAAPSQPNGIRFETTRLNIKERKASQREVTSWKRKCSKSPSSSK
jgi:hypothetical protein